MKLEPRIQEALSKAFRTIFEVQLKPEEIQLQPTKKDFAGTFTLVTFPYTKDLKRSPEQIAQALGEFVKENSVAVSDFNVVKGFLNLVISDKAWLEAFRGMVEQPDFGLQPASSRKVMVEYSSPNTNKPLHLGHLRNNFLGYSVSEILKATGMDVRKVNLVNDRGIHICKSMIAYQQLGRGETPAESRHEGRQAGGSLLCGIR